MANERPATISILAGFLVVVGVLNGAIFLVKLPRISAFHYGSNVPASVISVVEFLGVPGVLLVVLLMDAGIVALGIGLWLLRPWARTISLALSLLNLGAAFFGLCVLLINERSFSVAYFATVVFYIWVLYYFCLPNVKQAFNAAAST
jgi:hypothetical protein